MLTCGAVAHHVTKRGTCEMHTCGKANTMACLIITVHKSHEGHDALA